MGIIPKKSVQSIFHSATKELDKVIEQQTRIEADNLEKEKKAYNKRIAAGKEVSLAQKVKGNFQELFSVGE